MKAIFGRLRERYLRLGRRERGLAVFAAVALVAGAGDAALIEPPLGARAQLLRRIAVQHSERAALQQQLSVQPGDPNVALRSQLASLQTQVRTTDRDFAGLQHGLVQPQHMGGLLQSLLTEHRSLQLLGLRSLPVTAIGGAAAATAKRAAAASAAASPAAAADDAWLYRHSVEIRLQGGYADMLAYLQAIESQPRRVHWGDLEIDASRHPANVMTVTLFTVSLERSWWTP